MKLGHLTPAEVKRLVMAVRHPDHRLLLLIMFYHGLRVSEAINLRGKDIQFGHISVKRLKNSEPTRQKYYHSKDPDMDEAAKLEALTKSIGPDEKLFHITRNGVRKFMQRAGRQAGIDPALLHPHILKHSCAMASIKKKGIEYVRQRLGHKNISSTGAYLKVSDEETDREMEGVFG